MDVMGKPVRDDEARRLPALPALASAKSLVPALLGLIPLVLALRFLGGGASRQGRGVCVMSGHTKARADVLAITGAVEFYAEENDGRLPASLEPLLGGYLDIDRWPMYPWERPYVYERCAG
jgi:hypothetical protein